MTEATESSQNRTAAEADERLGRWLVENMPRGLDIELPDRSDDRPIPFIDYATDVQ